MVRVFLLKLKESVISVLPIVVIVSLMSLLLGFGLDFIAKFLFASLFVCLSLSEAAASAAAGGAAAAASAAPVGIGLHTRFGHGTVEVEVRALIQREAVILDVIRRVFAAPRVVHPVGEDAGFIIKQYYI